MSGVNRVILVGHVGKDPEVRYMPDGNPVASLSLATSETWRDKSTGDKKESTEWHRVVMFGKTADVAGEYAKKGSLICVEGKIKTKKWIDKEGHDRYTTEIHVDRLQLLGDGKREERQHVKSAPVPTRRSFEDIGDDIPF